MCEGLMAGNKGGVEPVAPWSPVGGHATRFVQSPGWGVSMGSGFCMNTIVRSELPGRNGVRWILFSHPYLPLLHIRMEGLVIQHPFQVSGGRMNPLILDM